MALEAVRFGMLPTTSLNRARAALGRARAHLGR